MTGRHAVACALFAEALRRNGSQQLVAGGRSMLPALWPGDRLVIQSTPVASLAAGDVVAWRRGAAIVVHRLVRHVARPDGAHPDGAHIVTRGDAMRADDEPVPVAAILGRVAGVRRGLFRVPAGPTPGTWRLAASLLGWWFAARQAAAIQWPHVRAGCLHARRSEAEPR